MTLLTPPSAEGLAERLAWQEVLFAAEPQRGELRRLVPAWPLAPVSVRVHRNHAVDAALSVATPYLRYAGLEPEWRLGDYDDSLSFAVPDDEAELADVEVVWLDFTRLGAKLEPRELADWLARRLAARCAVTNSPIVVLDWDGDRSNAAEFNDALQEACAALLGVHLVRRSETFDALGGDFFDPAREALTGTRMSAAGALASARELGSRWIPGALAPRRKAVVVDLDNTLYAGVLGEDGSAGLVLSADHAALQRQLLELRASGLFLALLSRNDPDQVEALFSERPDFPLGLGDFDATAIGWAAKSAGLAQIATALRIDPSAMIFLDDNPGELLETALSAPGLAVLRAEPDAAATSRALAHAPGLFSFGAVEEDGLRSADLAANAQRAEALAGASEDLSAYYRELGVSLTVGQNRDEELPRLGELPAKTNQFNLALARLSAAEVATRLSDPAWQVSSARLADRLSDSGIIALAIARRDGLTLRVEELCISCRAMGRRLEDLIVAQMLVSGPLWDGTETVRFSVAEGSRNHPARDWLAALAGPGSTQVDAARIRAASVNPDVRIEVRR